MTDIARLEAQKAALHPLLNERGITKQEQHARLQAYFDLAGEINKARLTTYLARKNEAAA